MSQPSETIKIFGAAENNLAAIDVEIPKRSLVVISGPSGSGKTSLALKTIYGESLFRTLALSNAVLGRDLYRPRVTEIQNLSPVIALEKGLFANRSKFVADLIGLSSSIRHLFLKHGQRCCEDCNSIIESFDRSQILDQIKTDFAGQTLAICAFFSQTSKIRSTFEALSKRGFGRFYVDDRLVENSTELLGSVQTLAVVVDRLEITSAAEAKSYNRLMEALDLAFELEPDGILVYEARNHKPLGRFSVRGICQKCTRVASELKLGDFKFQGASSTVLKTLHAGRTFEQIATQNIDDIYAWSGFTNAFVKPLKVLQALGLGYLNLGRPITSLSVGERQRLRIARQLMLKGFIGGLTYVIDEPTIGLHAKDTAQLITTLREIIGSGNSMIVVEHDCLFLSSADYLIELGPAGGREGGKLIYAGLPKSQSEAPSSLNSLNRHHDSSGGAALSGGELLAIRQANLNNLKNLSLDLPLNKLVVICGVSGSGKSSLILNTLYPALRSFIAKEEIDFSGLRLGSFRAQGLVQEVVAAWLQDHPNTTLSTVSTYIGVFEEIRKFFASLNRARELGLTNKDFSLSSKRNICKECKGTGVNSIGPGIVKDLVILDHLCRACGGKRFVGSVNEVKFKGLGIAEVLNLEVGQALKYLGFLPKVAIGLKALVRLNLAYLRIGELCRNLSGGEMQRLRLARDLQGRRTRAVYIFDEPTSGLDRNEVVNLLNIFREIVLQGNTLIAVEHNLNFIAGADYLVELGPAAGPRGGEIVFQGFPQDLSSCQSSPSAKYLREIFK